MRIPGYGDSSISLWTGNKQVSYTRRLILLLSTSLEQTQLILILLTDYVWGVVDMIPETDFPDIRNKAAIHSTNGSCMIIPREGDVVRLYIQLSDADAREVLNAKGRIDKTRWTPQRLMAIAKRSLQPYTIEFPEEVKWWTLYISELWFEMMSG